MSEDKLDKQSKAFCGDKPKNISTTCYKAPKFCLFNITADPCEYHDLSEKLPQILEMMKTRLQSYKDSMVPALRNATKDTRSNPKLHGGVWKPWVELEKTSSSYSIRAKNIKANPIVIP